MPSDDRVRLHDHQGRPPIAPGVGEQDPKQSIPMADVGTCDGAPEHGQLLTERHALERDGSVSRADQGEGSDQDDKRGQHELSCRAIERRINWWGWRSGSGEPQVKQLEADSKFFRSLVVLGLVALLVAAVSRHTWAAVGSLAAVAMCAWRFAERRWKATHRAFEYVIVLYGGNRTDAT